MEEITDGAVLTRGLGRSYGDASLPPPGRGPVACTRRADRVLEFDENSGLLRVEAGMRLGRLVDLFLPRGLFVPVTPGTMDVTIGGMVAADVHGKNHHVAGTIGAHVQALRLRLPDGEIRTVDNVRDADLFRATLGGMGLTGHVLDTTLTMERVPSAYIVEQRIACPDLESLIDGLLKAGRTSPFTVAWSDFLAPRSTMGHGVVIAGRWAWPNEAAGPAAFAPPSITIPWTMPNGLLSNFSIGAFHQLRYEYARRQRRGATNIRSARSFFYPLDSLHDWNRMYGRRGLTQYQCVVPHDASMRSYRRIAEVARSGGPGPFLAVIKDCGEQGQGLLSFPMPGVSFALDFPVHDGTPELVRRLNQVVIKAGGRVYLAKDAFTTAQEFAAMDPRVAEFRELRARIDPQRHIDSALARRVLGP